MKQSLILAATTALLSGATVAHAQITQIQSRSHISGTLIDWNGLYGPMPVLDASAFSGWKQVPDNAASISVTSIGDLSLQRQGSEWNGNFAHDDGLLRSTHSPISILFDQDVYAFGTNIQNAHWGTFTGVMSAFDANDQFLGSVELSGLSNALQGSAIFLGIASTDAMRRIAISTTGSYHDFAINQASFGEFSHEQPVQHSELSNNDLPVIVNPEPGTVVLLGAGMLLVGAAYRRRRAVA